jgi:glutaredoxin
MYVTPKRCPKCRYERQPADTAPEWQCPSCGVAYAKAEGSTTPLPAETRIRSRPASGGDGGLAKWVVTGLCAVGIGWLMLETFRHETQPRAIASAQASDEQPQVIMYATNWCPYCQQSREFFRRHGIVYTEYDVERDRDAYRENRRLGGGGVPMIVVGDQVVSGFNAQRLTQLLEPWMR